MENPGSVVPAARQAVTRVVTPAARTGGVEPSSAQQILDTITQTASATRTG